MICALSSDQLQGFQKYLAYKLENHILDNNPEVSTKDTFEAFIKEVVNELKTKADSPDRVALYTATIPSLLKNIASEKPMLLGFSKEKAIAYLDVLDRAYNPLKTDAEPAYLQLIKDFDIQFSDNLKSSIEALNKQYNIQSVDVFKKALAEASLPTPKEAKARLDKESTQIIINFSADAVSDSGTSAEDYNMPIESRQFASKVKKHILKNLPEARVKFIINSNLGDNYDTNSLEPGELGFIVVNKNGIPYEFEINGETVLEAFSGKIPVYKVRTKINDRSIQAKTDNYKKANIKNAEEKVKFEVEEYLSKIETVKQILENDGEVFTDIDFTNSSSQGATTFSFENDIITSRELINRGNKITITEPEKGSGPTSGFVAGRVNDTFFSKQQVERLPLSMGANSEGTPIRDIFNLLKETILAEPSEENINLARVFLGFSYDASKMFNGETNSFQYYESPGNMVSLSFKTDINAILDQIEKMINGDAWRVRTDAEVAKYEIYKGTDQKQDVYEKVKVGDVEFTKEPLKVNMPLLEFSELIIKDGKLIISRVNSSDSKNGNFFAEIINNFRINNTGFRIITAADGIYRQPNPYITLDMSSISLQEKEVSEEVEEPILEEEVKPVVVSKKQRNRIKVDIQGEEDFKRQGVEEIKSTKEQDEKALAWFNSSELKSQGVSLEDMRNLVSITNPNGIASFFDMTITLMNGSSLSDIYHEAFHAYTTNFLSPDQVKSLYNEVRKQKGQVKTYQGITKDFSSLSNLEAEEYLAEKFREYMLTNKLPIKTKEVKSWFTKLLNILKNLFKKGNLSVKEAFENLRYNNIEKVSSQPSKFGTLYKGVVYQDNGEQVILDEDSSKKLSDLIDLAFTQFILPENNTEMVKRAEDIKNTEANIQAIQQDIEEETDPEELEALNQELEETKIVLRTLKNRGGSQVYNIGSKKFFEQGYEYAKANLETYIKKFYGNNQELIDAAKKSFQSTDIENPTGLLAYHKVSSQIFNSALIDKAAEYEDTMEEKAQESGQSFERSGAEISALDRVKPRIRLMLNLIPRGLEITETDSLFNKILNETQNLTLVSEYIDYLSTFPEGTTVLKLLGKDEDNLSNFQAILWNDFISSFADVAVSPIYNVVEKKLDELNTKITLNEASIDTKKALNNISNWFISSQNPYSSYDPKNNSRYLDLKRIFEDFKDPKKQDQVVKAWVQNNNLSTDDLLDVSRDVRLLISILSQIPSLAENQNIKSTYDILKEANKNTQVGKLNLEIANKLAKYFNSSKSGMSIKADGNPMSEFQLKNSQLNILTLLNKPTVQTYQDAIKDPVLLKILSPERNPEIVPLLEVLFPGIVITNNRVENVLVSKRADNITQITIGGYQVKDEKEEYEGEDSSSLDPGTKILHDVVLSLSDKYEIPRISDKKPTYILSLPTYLFTSIETVKQGNHLVTLAEKLLPYLQGELDRMAIYRNTEDTEVDANVLERGSNLYTFKDLLSAQVVANLNEGQSIEENRQQIIFDLSEYIRKERNKLKAIASADETINFLNNKAQEVGLNVDQVLDRLVGNFMINAINTVNFIHGGSVQFKHSEDFFKRDAGATSTGTQMNYSDAVLNFINSEDQVWYTIEGVDKPENAARTYKAAIMEEPMISSSQETINNMKEGLKANGKLDAEIEKITSNYSKLYEVADAQGWITINAWKKFMIMNNLWTPEISALFKKEVTEGLTAEEAGKFFKVLKMQYYGQIVEGSVPQTAFHKFSLLPLIPSMIKNTPLERLHHNMMRSGVDYITPETGSKLSKPTLNNPDKLFTQDLKANEIESNSYFFDFLKNQLETGSKFKGKVSFITQMRKLIVSGLFSNGVPTDYKGTKQEWKALSPEDKVNKSPFYKAVKEYTDNLQAYQDYLQDKFEKDFNIDGSTIGKPSLSAINILEEELDRDANSIEYDELNKLKNLKDGERLHLESLTIGLRLQLIIKNQIDKINKAKVKGEGFIQASNLGFRNATLEENERWQSDLPFYKYTKDGVTPAKCKIAMQGDYLKLLQHPEIGGELSRLNAILKSEEELNKYPEIREAVKIIGARIPVQGKNSMEYFEVFEFLPIGSPNIIVVPQEMVVKSGSDFDVDKLTMMTKHIGIVNGIPQVLKEDSIDFYNSEVERLKNLINPLKSTQRDVRALLTDIKLYQAEIDDLEDGAEKSFLIGEVKSFREELKKLSPNKEETERILSEIKNLIEELAQVKKNLKEAKKGVLENNIQTSMQSILAIPELYYFLITPNTTDDVKKAISDEIQVEEYNKNNKGNEIENIKQIPKLVSDMFSPHTSLQKHQENSVGKAVLGIGANTNTHTLLAQQVGVEIPAEFDFHYSPGLTKEFGLATHINGLPVSEYISQLMNGWVDVAKDAWIFYLKGNKELGPLLLTMIRFGTMDPNDIVSYLRNNPFVKEYEALAKKANGPRGKKNKVKAKKEFVELIKKDLKNRKLDKEYTQMFQQKYMNINQSMLIEFLKAKQIEETPENASLVQRAQLLQLLELNEYLLSTQTLTSPDTEFNPDFSRDIQVAESQDPNVRLIKNDSVIGPYFNQEFKVKTLSEKFGKITFDPTIPGLIKELKNFKRNIQDSVYTDHLKAGIYQYALVSDGSKPNYAGYTYTEGSSFKVDGNNVTIDTNYVDDYTVMYNSKILANNYRMNLAIVKEEYPDIEEKYQKTIAGLRTVSAYNMAVGKVNFAQFYFMLRNNQATEGIFKNLLIYNELSNFKNDSVQVLELLNADFILSKEGVDFQNKIIRELEDTVQNIEEITKDLKPAHRAYVKEFFSLLPYMSHLQTEKTKGSKAIKKIVPSYNISSIKNNAIDSIEKLDSIVRKSISITNEANNNRMYYAYDMSQLLDMFNLGGQPTSTTPISPAPTDTTQPTTQSVSEVKEEATLKYSEKEEELFKAYTKLTEEKNKEGLTKEEFLSLSLSEQQSHIENLKNC